MATKQKQSNEEIYQHILAMSEDQLRVALLSDERSRQQQISAEAPDVKCIGLSDLSNTLNVMSKSDLVEVAFENAILNGSSLVTGKSVMIDRRQAPKPSSNLSL